MGLKRRLGFKVTEKKEKTTHSAADALRNAVDRLRGLSVAAGAAITAAVGLPWNHRSRLAQLQRPTAGFHSHATNGTTASMSSSDTPSTATTTRVAEEGTARAVSIDIAGGTAAGMGRQGPSSDLGNASEAGGSLADGDGNDLQGTAWLRANLTSLGGVLDPWWLAAVLLGSMFAIGAGVRELARPGGALDASRNETVLQVRACAIQQDCAPAAASRSARELAATAA